MDDPDGHGYDMQHGGYGMMDGGGGSDWIVVASVLVLVLLLIALVAVLAHLFLHVTRGPGSGTSVAGASAPEARLVLDGRLARGEVSPEEYQSVRALLDSGG
jgi:putative membrane protein